MPSANDYGGGKSIRPMKDKEPLPKHNKHIEFHATQRKLGGTKEGVIAIDVIMKGIEPNFPEIAAEAMMLGTEYWANAADQDIDEGMVDNPNLKPEHILHMQELEPVERLDALFKKKFDKHGTATLEGEGELQRMSRKGNQTY